MGDLDRGIQSKIMGLYPDISNLAGLLIADVLDATGYVIRLSEAFRSYPYQDALYAEGRTSAGDIVTWAKGGQSYHNFCCAFDIAFRGLDPYLEHDQKKDQIWNYVIGEAEQLGLTAGANFPGSKRDMPHFEKTYGMTEMQMDEILKEGGMSALWGAFDGVLGITNVAWQGLILPDPQIGGYET